MSRHRAQPSGQVVEVFPGGPVDTADRLLSVAELQDALRLARQRSCPPDFTPISLSGAINRRRGVPVDAPGGTLDPDGDPLNPAAGDLPATDKPVIAADHPVANPLVVGPAAAEWGANPVPVHNTARPRRWSPRWRTASTPRAGTGGGPVTGDGDAPAASAASGAAAPAGFTGPAAVRAWSFLTTATPAPQVLVCAASGGVGVTTVVAALAGLMAAARPDRVLAVEVARRDYSPLTRQVCGSVDAVSAGTWLPRDGEPEPQLADLPAGPSGARVVQAGAQWWPRLVDQLDGDTAVVADLGSLEHADTRVLLLEHSGPAVLVARADSAGVTAALAALTELDAAGLSRRPVLVLCDAAGSRPGVLRTAQRLAATAADVLVLPKAPVLRRSPVPVGGWDRGLSSALADLVCALARTANPPDTSLPTLRPLPIADPTHDAEHS